MRKTEHETNKPGPAAPAAATRSAAEQTQLPFFDAVMPPTMTTENTSPNDAQAAPGGAVDPHSANGTGAELLPADAGTLMPTSATPEAAHQAALAADAIARAGTDASATDAPTELSAASAAAEPQMPPAALPEAAHAAALAADAALHAEPARESDAAPAAMAPEPDAAPAAAADNAVLPAEFETAADFSAQAATDAHVESEALAESVLAANVVELPESLGQRLRAAREARGMKMDDAAHAMKLPLSTVQALEGDRYERIGEGIYLRSYLAKYLRLLDLPQVLAERVLTQAAQPPPLVMSGTISRPRYLFERYSSSALYLILTAVIIVPAVWLAMRGGFEAGTVQITPLDSAEPASGIVARGNAPSPASAAPSNGERPEDAPLAASMAPFPAIKRETEASDSTPVAAKPAPAAPAPDGTHTLRLTLPEASWVEIVANDGEKIEYGLLPAGTTRTYHSAKSVDIRLGNAAGATFEIDGKAQDIGPYRHSNVAHFRLNGSDGTISHSGG